MAPLHPWLWPSKPWQRIHIDYAGPVRGRMLLVVIDAHSKWPEVIEMSSTTSCATIRVLRTLFATYGLPRQLVSDNGPQFTSLEFEHFLKLNGVKHVLSTPYHPATNGATECLVKSVKRALKAGGKSDFHQVLSAFLLRTRITPHSTTNKAPAELFLKRSLRTRFDLLRPSAEEQVMMRQSMQKTYHDQHSRSREFVVGQRVLARNFRAGQRWLPGIITERRGPLSYLVQLQQGILCKRHIDQLLEATHSPASGPDHIRGMKILNQFQTMSRLI